MRGGMHTGQSSKNSSAVPWIAGATLLGTGGLLFGAYQTRQLRDALAKNTELHHKIEKSVDSLNGSTHTVHAGSPTKTEIDTFNVEKENLSKQLADAKAAAQAAEQLAAQHLRDAQTKLATTISAATASKEEKTALQAEVAQKTKDLNDATILHTQAQAGLTEQQRLRTAAEEALAAYSETFAENQFNRKVETLKQQYTSTKNELLQKLAPLIQGRETSDSNNLALVTQLLTNCEESYNIKYNINNKRRLDEINAFLTYNKNLCQYINRITTSFTDLAVALQAKFTDDQNVKKDYVQLQKNDFKFLKLLTKNNTYSVEEINSMLSAATQAPATAAVVSKQTLAPATTAVASNPPRGWGWSASKLWEVPQNPQMIDGFCNREIRDYLRSLLQKFSENLGRQ
jgi:chromosome segregation ATPase